MKDGYARNFLLPQRKAVPVTSANLHIVEAEQKRRLIQLEKDRSSADAVAQRLHEMSVTIQVQVGEGEKLFGSVTSKDIAAALAKEGVTIEKQVIELDAPIKHTGEFTVPIRLHPEVSVPLRVWVVPEAGE